MEFGDIWSYIVAVIGAGGITQLVNWRINKKKASVEVQSSELQLIAETVRTVYEPIIDQQNRTIEKNNERINALEAEVEKLREEKHALQDQYQEQIQKLEKRILEITRAVGLNTTKQVRDANGRFTAKMEED